MHPSSTLTPFHPELTRLVEVGLLERAAVNDGAREGEGAFGELARAATARGLVTASQARALAALLGRPRPANDG